MFEGRLEIKPVWSFYQLATIKCIHSCVGKLIFFPSNMEQNYGIISASMQKKWDYNGICYQINLGLAYVYT